VIISRFHFEVFFSVSLEFNHRGLLLSHGGSQEVFLLELLRSSSNDVSTLLQYVVAGDEKKIEKR